MALAPQSGQVKALLAACSILLGGVAARADSYHYVEAGDTLNGVAARYGVSPELIRSSNRLGNLAVEAALPTMLLRIPAAGATSAGTGVKASRPASGKSTTGYGVAVNSLRYTVEKGDTVESIARRYSAFGYPVQASAIRQRNELTGEPQPGQVLVLPLGSAPTRQAGLVRISATNPESGAGEEPGRPVARVLSSDQGGYENPYGGQRSAPAARRGALGSRSYSPSGAGVRVLRPDEDGATVTEPPGSRPRVVRPPASQSKMVARVAQVVHHGGKIRRLPTSEAVSLYRCPAGTQLAVTRQSRGWSAILMSDRTTGWIPSRYLRFTAASIELGRQTGPAWAGEQTSRGVTGQADGSNHPFIAEALTYLGTPYVYGGSTRRGIDCSALVQNVFRTKGYRLPRTAAQQARVGMPIDPSQLQPGDRLYFSASGSRIDHTGLYMGNGRFVHASGRGRAVIVSNLFDSGNWNIFVGAKR